MNFHFSMPHNAKTMVFLRSINIHLEYFATKSHNDLFSAILDPRMKLKQNLCTHAGVFIGEEPSLLSKIPPRLKVPNHI